MIERARTQFSTSRVTSYTASRFVLSYLCYVRDGGKTLCCFVERSTQPDRDGGKRIAAGNRRVDKHREIFRNARFRVEGESSSTRARAGMRATSTVCSSCARARAAKIEGKDGRGALETRCFFSSARYLIRRTRAFPRELPLLPRHTHLVCRLTP